MKLLIVSAALACFFCLVVGCNSKAFKSSGGALIADAKTPQDVYKLSTDPKKDKGKALAVTFNHLNHTTKPEYSVDGTHTEAVSPAAC